MYYWKVLCCITVVLGQAKTRTNLAVPQINVSMIVSGSKACPDVQTHSSFTSLRSTACVSPNSICNLTLYASRNESASFYLWFHTSSLFQQKDIYMVKTFWLTDQCKYKWKEFYVHKYFKPNTTYMVAIKNRLKTPPKYSSEVAVTLVFELVTPEDEGDKLICMMAPLLVKAPRQNSIRSKRQNTDPLRAMSILNSFVNDIFERVAAENNKSAKNHEKLTAKRH